VLLVSLGEHHVMNASLPSRWLRELGVDLDTAITALESVLRAERWRMELLT
jgi:UDP-N-acetylmuramoyl-tripeptide--D-alanyl-D-alanine ligase